MLWVGDVQLHRGFKPWTTAKLNQSSTFPIKDTQHQNLCGPKWLTGRHWSGLEMFPSEGELPPGNWAISKQNRSKIVARPGALALQATVIGWKARVFYPLTGWLWTNGLTRALEKALLVKDW